MPPAEPPPPTDMFRILSEVLHQILHRLVLRVHGYGNRFVLVEKACDRHRVAERHCAVIRQDRAQHHAPEHKDGVRIVAVGCNEFREPDRTSGPGAVHHLHRNRDNLFRGQYLLDQPCGLIPSATGICRCHDGYGFRRKRRRKGQGENGHKMHCAIVCTSTAPHHNLHHDGNSENETQMADCDLGGLPRFIRVIRVICG